MIGRNIYFFRKLKGLTQAELAQGICSVPHLSKIENGHETPSADMIEHFSRRLSVSIDELASKNYETTYTEILDEWYATIVNREKDQAKSMYALVVKKLADVQYPHILLKYKIYMLRYKLLVRELEDAKEILHELKQFDEKLPSDLAYHYYLAYGLYTSVSEDYMKALTLLKKSESILNQLRIQDPDVYFYLSIVNLQLNRTFYSFKYADTALQIFDKNCNYIRSIDCQIIIAVNMTRIHDYDQAETHLRNALQLCKALDNQGQISDIYHNLGYLFYTMGHFDKSIKYYQLSLDYLHDNKHVNSIVTFYCLAKSYSMLNDLRAMEIWVDLGQGLAKKFNRIQFIHHFNVIRLQTLSEDVQLLESTLQQDVIPYFEEKRNWYYVAEYAEQLASLYANKSKYKNASYYYNLAVTSRKKLLG